MKHKVAKKHDTCKQGNNGAKRRIICGWAGELLKSPELRRFGDSADAKKWDLSNSSYTATSEMKSNKPPNQNKKYYPYRKKECCIFKRSKVHTQ